MIYNYTEHNDILLTPKISKKINALVKTSNINIFLKEIKKINPDEDKIVDWKTNLVRYDVRDNHPLGLYAWGVGQLKNRTRVEGKQLHSRSSEKCD